MVKFNSHPKTRNWIITTKEFEFKIAELKHNERHSNYVYYDKYGN